MEMVCETSISRELSRHRPDDLLANQFPIEGRNDNELPPACGCMGHKSVHVSRKVTGYLQDDSTVRAVCNSTAKRLPCRPCLGCQRPRSLVMGVESAFAC